MARKLGCCLLMLGLVLLGALAVTGCGDMPEINAINTCRNSGGVAVFVDGHYAHCEALPQPCPPAGPLEAP